MGYTHYFEVTNKTGKVSLASEKKWTKATNLINTLVYNFSQEHGGISGFSAHAVPGKYSGVKFNGSRDNGCEDFFLRETYSLQSDVGFSCCKTNRLPYDVLVTASLCILHHYLGNKVIINSDGDYPDWAVGAELASTLLGTKVTVPPKILRTSQRHLKVVG